MPIEPLQVAAYTAVSALGRGRESASQALNQGKSALTACDFMDARLDTWIGRVPGLENEAVDGELQAFDCRSHRLARLALRQDGFDRAVAAAVDRYTAQRIGVYIGTSTSGILSTENAYRERADLSARLPATFSYRHTHDVFAPAEFVQRALGLRGPVLGVSTACSSSAKVFASAYRAIAAGLCDAAVVGGVDSLCLTTLCGFHSLQLTSSSPCRPWDAARDGLSIGEAAGFMLLVPQQSEWRLNLALLGYGESSDAHHMSAAHPQGAGARQAMQQALARAGLAPEQVDYVNLHGTATPSNDAAEDRAVSEVFGEVAVPCSSTKGWTGHALGAAGILEAVLACVCIEDGFVPGTLNTERPDPALRANLQLQTERREVRTVLSNSFGFGGSNCSLLFGRAA